MKEVSCKAFEIFYKPLEKKRVELGSVLTGTALTVETVRDKNERVSWADFCTIMRNLRPHFSDDEFVEMGRSHLRGPVLRFIGVVARLRFNPIGFYRWFNTPREGAGNQLFSCIVPALKDVSDSELELTLTVPEDYEVCWDFFTVTKGNLEEMPRLLGYPAAFVRLERIPRGARFHIRVPQRTPFLTRTRQAVSWPFTVRAAALQLKEAHETLRDRYEQLEDAQSRLDIQATRLRTAHTISELIHGDLDLQRTVETVAKALVEQASYAWAEIKLSAVELPAVEFGTRNGETPVQRTLTAGVAVLGEISVCAKANADRLEREELLVFVLPTLAMAIQNAIAYRELAEYKAGLERIVDERTAELRQARDQLAGSVVQLREAQEARERFFGNISHEIRTPLSLILLAAADIDRRAGHMLDDRARGGLGAVSDAARKLVRLVDELLLLAAGQADKLKIATEPTDICLLLQHLVSAWRPAAEAAGHELHASLPERLFINVDPVAIERVASNLVSNAVKYTPRGGRIEIQLAVGDELRLSVLDTGPGIDDDLVGRLFGRFERGAATDRRQGTGIGLALVKQLVEAHGATVEALRRDSAGTEMRIVFPRSIVVEAPKVPTAPVPLRITHAATATTTSIASGLVFTPSGLSQGTILIAEDEPRLAESIAQLLSDEYTVVVALDGQAALALVKQHQPQLLITDVDMPGMNGIELSRRFREVTGDNLAPIVILSAVVDLRTRVAGLEAGAVDYVSKPFDPTELRARVQSQFRMRDLAMRLHRAEQLSSLGILTAGLSHELRNPANGIVNAIPPLLQLLPRELTGPDTGPGELLDVMRECADQIGFLSRQLLGFRSNAKLELRPVAVPDLVQRAVNLSNGALHGIDLRTKVTVEGTFMCAPPLLVQVLTNLIENAGHAAGVGGWVEVSANAVNGKLTVEVADSGSGVPVELRERVFEPFFTTKPPGAGTGLGLSLARNIIHRHGGVLEIRDRGARSVFVVELNAGSNLARSTDAV